MSILQETQERIQLLEIDIVNESELYNERTKILDLKPKDVKTVDYPANSIHEVMGIDKYKFATIYNRYIRDNFVNGNGLDDINYSDFHTFTCIHNDGDNFRLFSYINENFLFGHFNFIDAVGMQSTDLVLEKIYLHSTTEMSCSIDIPPIVKEATQKIYDMAKVFSFEDYRRNNQINESLLERLKIESMERLRVESMQTPGKN